MRNGTKKLIRVSVTLMAISFKLSIDLQLYLRLFSAVFWSVPGPNSIFYSSNLAFVSKRYE